MFPSKIAGLGKGVLGKVTFWLTLAPYRGVITSNRVTVNQGFQIGVEKMDYH
jgi:hypothetical protein